MVLNISSGMTHASFAGLPLISVVVVSYNTCKILRDCLHSLDCDPANGREVLVVDNRSMDRSAQMVREEFAQVRLIENQENSGFARANNQGIALARGKYILLLNSDTMVRPGALKAMTDFLDAHPEAGGVTCRLLNADGTIQACVSGRPGPMLLFFRLSGLSRAFRGDRARRFLRRYAGLLLGATARGYFDPYVAAEAPIQVENISGACLMLRREAIERAGLLDENFFMYFEDMDYCLRLRNLGWKLYYVPSGEIVHLVGQSSGGRMRNSIHSYRSLFYFYRKHFSPRSLFAVRVMVLISTCARWIWNLLGARISDPIRCRRNRVDLAQVIRLCFEWS